MQSPKHMPAVEAVAALEEVDVAIADVLVPHTEHAAIQAIGAISDLSDQEPLYAAAAATLGVAVVLRDGRTWRAGTRVLAAHLLATGLRGIVKAMVDRTRPDAAVERGEYVLGPGEHRQSEFNSFPSGHTAGAVAVARAVGRHYPGSHHAALGLAAAAGVAQVVRSKHYVTDVLAGAVIGLVAEILVDRLIRRAERV